jgi:hypothetical protein
MKILLVVVVMLVSGCALILPSPTYPIELNLPKGYSQNSLFNNQNRWRIYKSSTWDSVQIVLMRTETSDDSLNGKKFFIKVSSPAYYASVSKSPISLGELTTIQLQNLDPKAPRYLEITAFANEGPSITRIVEVEDSSFR